MGAGAKADALTFYALGNSIIRYVENPPTWSNRELAAALAARNPSMGSGYEQGMYVKRGSPLSGICVAIAPART